MDDTPTIDPLAAPESRLLSLCPDLLGVVGPDGALKAGNPAWSAALGLTGQELRTTAFVDLIHPEDRRAMETVLDGLVAGGLAERRCRMMCANGDERQVSWRAERAAGDDCVYLAGRDVTDLERAAAELQDFAYVASHDLAEPLRMVTSYLELLQRRYGGRLDETADEFIGYAVDGAARMKQMIEALLAFSRVGTHVLEPVEFDLRELLGSQIDAVVLSEPLAPVRADPTQAKLLLHHLIDNAIKFRAPDREPEVTISAVPENDGVRIDVADNGLGIAEAQQERIFKMFTRLHGRDDFAGAGVGLALCRRIAERHGGRITVSSEPAGGSVFSVWLPA